LCLWQGIFLVTWANVAEACHKEKPDLYSVAQGICCHIELAVRRRYTATQFFFLTFISTTRDSKRRYRGATHVVHIIIVSLVISFVFELEVDKNLADWEAGIMVDWELYTKFAG
ncbi:hypothetical protein ACJX0J_018935, partial [Zea mays]